MPLLPKPPSGNDSDAPIAGVVPVELMTGEDDEDTALLRRMSQDAEAYLRSFSWCKEVSGSFFGGGVGGIIAVFLFNIRPARPAVGSWIWIIVGDIPSAYLPLEDAASPADGVEPPTPAFSGLDMPIVIWLFPQHLTRSAGRFCGLLLEPNGTNGPVGVCLNHTPIRL
jgi:hypothetical protein